MQENTTPNSQILRFEKLYKITDPLCCDKVFIKENENNQKTQMMNSSNENSSNENSSNEMTSIDIYESLTPLIPIKTKSCCPSFGILSRWRSNH